MKAEVNIWNEPMIPRIRLKNMTGEISGKVILKNLRNTPAPSTPADSYSSCGICFSPARKIIMVEPNCHVFNRIKVPSAVLGLEIHAGPCMPIRLRIWLMYPSRPNMLRQRTETAMLAPISEGK
ncbi:hypothetical protein D3C73_1450610 [compost metagenome]